MGAWNQYYEKQQRVIKIILVIRQIWFKMMLGVRVERFDLLLLERIFSLWETITLQYLKKPTLQILERKAGAQALLIEVSCRCVLG